MSYKHTIRGARSRERDRERENMGKVVVEKFENEWNIAAIFSLKKNGYKYFLTYKMTNEKR